MKGATRAVEIVVATADERQLEHIERLLGSLYNRVTTVRDGRDLEEVLSGRHEANPDLLMMDYGLWGVETWHAVRRLRQQMGENGTTWVLMASIDKAPTHEAQRRLREQALEAGIHFLLPTPHGLTLENLDELLAECDELSLQLVRVVRLRGVSAVAQAKDEAAAEGEEE